MNYSEKPTREYDIYTQLAAIRASVVYRGNDVVLKRIVTEGIRWRTAQVKE